VERVRLEAVVRQADGRRQVAGEIEPAAAARQVHQRRGLARNAG
jgi:hypothetical protein